ncbi:hypothetical protein [Erythrobacter oryzae]|uniref:hypothetical protein n=1 Tax=Erythrobacter oryzae TaxID=3019556 RepID=UPI0025575DDD|nr:hypothetical protein [Erythrobacter sp. COR-2]
MSRDHLSASIPAVTAALQRAGKAAGALAAETRGIRPQSLVINGNPRRLLGVSRQGRRCQDNSGEHKTGKRCQNRISVFVHDQTPVSIARAMRDCWRRTCGSVSPERRNRAADHSGERNDRTGAGLASIIAADAMDHCHLSAFSSRRRRID